MDIKPQKLDINDYIDTLVKGDKQSKLYFLDKIQKNPFLNYRILNNTTRRFHSSTARIKGLFGGNRSMEPTSSVI